MGTVLRRRTSLADIVCPAVKLLGEFFPPPQLFAIFALVPGVHHVELTAAIGWYLR